MPGAWRQEPFCSGIRQWAQAAARTQRQVIVRDGNSKMVISPEEATGLGELSPSSRRDLRSLNVSDGDLTGSAIRLGVKTDLLSLDQTAHSGALKRSCVDENVFATVIRLDEAEAFLIVIELDSASFHRTSSHELAVLGSGNGKCHAMLPMTRGPRAELSSRGPQRMKRGFAFAGSRPPQ
jgi:hypothetical protein